MGSGVSKTTNRSQHFSTSQVPSGYARSSQANYPRNNSVVSANQQSRFSSQSTTDNYNMPCSSCSTQFTFMSKKLKCEKCQLIFCEGCLVPVESSGTPLSSSNLLCLSCIVFSGPVLLKSQLLRLRVRDLMRQLRSRGVEHTRGCLTKVELVNLLANMPNVTLMDDVMPPNTDSSPSSTVGDADYPRNTVPPHSSAAPHSTPSHSHNQNQVPNGSSGEPEKSSQPKERKKLSSIEKEEDIDKLPVRELKEILVNNFVVIRGLCEKEELVQKAKMLWRQEIGQRRSANIKNGFQMDGDFDLREEDTCKICMDATINCVLLECGHMVSCVTCGKLLSECPICRQYVVRAVHTFRT